MKEAVKQRCRCHGLSGTCQYQTCWDQLEKFHLITSKLRSIYLLKSTKVSFENLGTLDKPDLHLVRENMPRTKSYGENVTQSIKSWEDLGALLLDSSYIADIQKPRHRFTSNELIYLHESPDYCESQPSIEYQGTKGRSCFPINDTKTLKKNILGLTEMADINGITNRDSLIGATGSCEQLCCDRGYYSELVLDMITCNCRFKFCCKVECEQCLRQRSQHYCL